MGEDPAFQRLKSPPTFTLAADNHGASGKVKMLVSLYSVGVFVTPWTVAPQAPLSMSPGKHTGVGCHFLLQGIFLTQGSNPHLLRWQVGFLPLSHLGS